VPQINATLLPVVSRRNGLERPRVGCVATGELERGDGAIQVRRLRFECARHIRGRFDERRVLLSGFSDLFAIPNIQRVL